MRGEGMSSCAVTPQMMGRMVCQWLPTGTEALSWEDPMGDIFVQWDANAAIQIQKADRVLSMDMLGMIYKPAVDAKLIDSWTLVSP